MDDLVGKKFDMLEVKKFAKRTHYHDNMWECQCDCGKIVTRTQKTLENASRFHSCGCYNKQFLTPGDKERCSKAGKQRAHVRNVDGINMDMLNNSKNISTNTSGHKGISWSKTAHKWHVFVGYKSYRCNLGYVEDIKDAVALRERALDEIKNGTFEEFFYELRGFRIEEKLQKLTKRNRD